MMTPDIYGDEWDSEEFQAVLKVVLKFEIQSLVCKSHCKV